MEKVSVANEVYVAADKAGARYGAAVQDGDVIGPEFIKLSFDAWAEDALDVDGADDEEVALLLATFQSGFVSGIPRPWLKGDVLWTFVSRLMGVAAIGAGVEMRKKDTSASFGLDGFAGSGVSVAKLRQLFDEWAADGMDLAVEREQMLFYFMAGYQKEHLKMVRAADNKKEG